MRPKNVLLEDFLATLLVQFEDDSRGGDSFPIQSRFDAYAWGIKLMILRCINETPDSWFLCYKIY